MANIQVSVINACPVLQDSEVQAIVPSLQKQVSQDFAPAWGFDADLTFVRRNGQPPPGSWWLVILDNSDQAGALGYHDITTEGLPLGKVFAASDLQFGNNWTVTASHELLEMLGDPDINLTVFIQPDATSGILYAYEVCDACEADNYGYVVDGVTVSPSIDNHVQRGAIHYEAARPTASRPLRNRQGDRGCVRRRTKRNPRSSGGASRAGTR